MEEALNGSRELSCELFVFLSQVAVTAFAAAGFFRVVGLVLCVAFSADVDVSEKPVLSFVEFLCHIFISPYN